MAGFEIRIVTNAQTAVKGARVRLEFTGIRGMSAGQYTDSDGVARFDHYDEGEIRVYVDGRDCGKYKYTDGKSITITK